MLDWNWLLPLVWVVIIATGIVMYVILDGFDLGVGICSRRHEAIAHAE